MRRFESILGLIFGLGIFTLILFSALRYAQIPVGNLIDWIIGFATSAWLLTIITIPWNIYFEANTVLYDAKLSEKKQIKFDTQELKYVNKVAKVAFNVAIILHVVSAVGLYALAYFEVSVVGYYGSIASILLTFLRPALRLYQYVSERLSNIRFEVKYPRDDVYELSNKLSLVEEIVKDLSAKLDKDDQTSWLRRQEQASTRFASDIKYLQKNVQDMQELITTENERILKETQKAVAQVNQEGKFVDKFIENLVEIVRFIKRA